MSERVNPKRPGLQYQSMAQLHHKDSPSWIILIYTDVAAGATGKKRVRLKTAVGSACSGRSSSKDGNLGGQ